MENRLEAHTFRNYVFQRMTQEGLLTVYELSGSEGEGHGEIRCYQILPGILLSYDKLDMRSCYQKVEPVYGYIQINHCREGCFEFELADGHVCFMGEGDMCVSNPWSRAFQSSRLPTEHYRGLSILLEIETAQASLNGFFPQASVDIWQLQKALFSAHPSFHIRAKAELDHIFTQLYRVDERIRCTYCAIKVLEILLFLQLTLDDPHDHLPRFSQSVVSRTKQVYEYLNQCNYRKITVKALSDQFHIAQSVLQQCFKSIYGQPIAAFLRTQRIRQSAFLLREDDSLSVGEIAQFVGYENQSKFASAFKAIMGLSPLAYRHRAAEHIPIQLEPKRNVLEWRDPSACGILK